MLKRPISSNTIRRPIRSVWMVGMALCIALCDTCLVAKAQGNSVQATLKSAAKTSQTPPGVQLEAYWENDGGYHIPGGTDRHYTNGFGFSIAGQTDWSDTASSWMLMGQPHDETTSQSAFGVLIGQEMYTPADLQRVPPDPDDWPYAGYLYGGFFLQRQAQIDTAGIDAVFDHFQIDIGVVGNSSQADELQRAVHNLIDDERPQGWEDQLEDEVTLQTTYRRKWRATLLGPKPDNEDSHQAVSLQLIPRVEARLGTVHVDATLGAMLRAGINLGNDFGPGFLHDPSAASANLPRDGWSIYAFADASARVVGHNIFLDGGTFQNGPSVAKEPVVGQLAGGLSLSYRFVNGNRVGLNYGLWWQTAQAQTHSGGDTWGQLAITAQWAF